MKHGKYLTIKKEGKGIKYYYVDTDRHWIQIEFVPRVYFGMSYTPEWHEYIKKTSIKISPFNIHYFLRDIGQIMEKCRNMKYLNRPREIPIRG